ncbi:SNF2 family N-terminal domain-containing protein, partial [Dendryphion nanum]
NDRPRKKRRFFVDESPSSPTVQSIQQHRSSSPAVSHLSSPGPSLDGYKQEDGLQGKELIDTDGEDTNHTSTAQDVNDSFDVGLLQAVVGELPPLVLDQLRKQSNNDVQRAINIYLDGTFSRTLAPASAPSASSNLVVPTTSSVPSTSRTKQTTIANGFIRREISESYLVDPPSPPDATPPCLKDMPLERYIGSFGAVGWATKSGKGLLGHGEKIRIERINNSNKSQPLSSTKRRIIINKKHDIIVRFTNDRGEEVGRLENEFAAWVSTLIDQNMCSFDGIVVYVPDRLRTNDTIYLQLRCRLLRSAFDRRKFAKPDNNRNVGLFEEKESQDERDLRLRQVAMVKLFEAIGMHPTRENETTEKHKRQGLLQAAEKAETGGEPKAKPKTASSTDPASSPPSDQAEEGEELEQDQLDSLYKKAQSFDFDTPTMDPASTFTLDLRKYQKQALWWMVGKEKDESLQDKEVSMHPLWEEYAWPTEDANNNPVPTVNDQSMFYVNPYSGEMSIEFPKQEQNCLGGILADEMGLGKTIEMLSLIHTHRNEVSKDRTTLTKSLPRLTEKSIVTEEAPYTTLVVAPMSLLAQWASESEKASKEGTLKVLVYYGAEKSVNLQKLCCAANGANAPNVIITSYGTILSEFNQVAAMDGNRGSHGGLFSLDYFRIILDEAHFIKNRQSKTAKACYELNATHRWALTGTPIVNRLEDLFSLVRFLKVEPWSNFSFWKTFITVPFESGDFIRALDVVQTVLEPLVMRRTKDMKTPTGEALVPLPPRTIEVEKIKLSQDEREVYDHIYMRAKRVFAANAEAGTLLKSYTTIFAQILRLRQSCCNPILTRKKDVVADEEDAAFASDLANGLADDMDLQSLIARFTSDDDQDVNKFGANVLKQIQDEAGAECPICSEEPMVDQAVTGCWHSACKECLLGYINHQRDRNIIPLCFNCREPINVRDVFEVVRHDHVDQDDGNGSFDSALPPSATQTPRISLRRIGLSGSAKTQALLTHLKALRRDPELRSSKSVVFSQFTSFLDLISPALERDHIPFLRFDGTLSQPKRAAILAEFAASPKPYVLLLSLRAGGVGLNLTCAQHVFMMDPWWSFAVEAQAIDRVHRMGQEKDVRVIRFVVEESIEEKMLRVQERKKFM